MKVCIYGAGAIGTLLGARLAAGGECSVSAVARGATLKALHEQGWRLKHGETVLRAPLAAAGDARDLGPQDLVIIAVKGPALPQVAADLAPLLGPDTCVMPAMNGVLWWFSAGVPELDAAPLESIDPGGRTAKAIPVERVVGCVVHASAAVLEPGLVEHKMGQGLIIGEPLKADSERVRRLARVLAGSGFEPTVSPNIRRDLWYKLWGNMTMNPISALTGAACDQLLDDELVRGFCAAAMREAGQIGARIGCQIDQTPEDRFAVTRKLGSFKTSMLQDVEAGRGIELDALLGAVREIGLRLGVPTPTIDALYALTRLFGRVRGVYT
jgi:2-dehydropantoate 2-reductase